jgi:hypothetical protein
VKFVVSDCHYTCHPQCRNLVKLDCRGESDAEISGPAVPDAELESVEHVVGLEEITDPSLEPLLQEVSSKVNLESQIFSRRTLGFSEFLSGFRHMSCLA